MISIANTGGASSAGDISTAFDSSGGDYLVAIIFIQGNPTFVEVSYNGEALTQQVVSDELDIGQANVFIYTLANPAAGENTFVSDANKSQVVFLMSLKNVNIADAIEGTGTDSSITILDVRMGTNVNNANTASSMIIQGGFGEHTGSATWEQINPDDSTELKDSQESNVGGGRSNVIYKTFTGSGEKNITSDFAPTGDLNYCLSVGIMLNGAPTSKAQMISDI